MPTCTRKSKLSDAVLAAGTLACVQSVASCITHDQRFFPIHTHPVGDVGTEDLEDLYSGSEDAVEDRALYTVSTPTDRPTPGWCGIRLFQSAFACATMSWLFQDGTCHAWRSHLRLPTNRLSMERL